LLAPWYLAFFFDCRDSAADGNNGDGEKSGMEFSLQLRYGHGFTPSADKVVEVF
jgi:hypothetical protein